MFFRGFCIGVPDGDGCHLSDGTQLRYESVHAPELHRLGGLLAKQLNEGLVSSKWIQYTIEARDVYGRIVSNVYVGTMWVNDYLRKQGYR